MVVIVRAALARSFLVRTVRPQHNEVASLEVPGQQHSSSQSTEGAKAKVCVRLTKLDIQDICGVSGCGVLHGPWCDFVTANFDLRPIA